MADAKFSIGQIGITGYLVINARKTTDPSVIAYTQTIPPPIGTTRDIIFSNIDPAVYYFDFRDSSNGILIGTLLATYTIDVVTKQITSEKRFYTVGGPRDIDPIAGNDTLTDPFLDGKVSALYKAERFLIPPGQPNQEYENIAGGTIHLLSGLIFSDQEVVMVEVNYTIVQQSNAVQGIFAGSAIVSSNVTLDNTFYNKLISCESPSSRLVITLPDITTIPDGKFFYFIFQSGTQYQVRFLTQGANKIQFAGGLLPEISIGRGEVLWIEKRGSYFRVLSDAAGCLSVGQNLSANDINHPNTLLCNAVLLDGDDYPRIWYWIDKVLGTANQIIDDAVVNSGYTQPAGKETVWARHSSLKKFRTPNKQGWYERGMDNMTTDTVSYPGYTKTGQVQGHFHDVGTEGDTSAKFNRDIQGGIQVFPVHETRHWNVGNGNTQLSTTTDINKKPDGSYATKNEVNASLIIYLVRI